MGIYGGVGWAKPILHRPSVTTLKKSFQQGCSLCDSEKFINQFMDHSRNNAINDFSFL
jgi:chromosomal replication initiator protein